MIQRRALAGISIAASALVLSACGFQSPAITNTEHTSDQGGNFRVGSILVRNAFVTTLQTSETATTSYVVATLVNESKSPDTLTGITTPAGTVGFTGDGVFDGGVTVAPNGVPTRIDQPLLSPNGPTATLAASKAPGAGSLISLSFTFATAGSSPTIQVPVVPPTETTAVASPIPSGEATPPTETGETTDGSN